MMVSEHSRIYILCWHTKVVKGLRPLKSHKGLPHSVCVPNPLTLPTFFEKKLAKNF